MMVSALRHDLLSDIFSNNRARVFKKKFSKKRAASQLGFE